MRGPRTRFRAFHGRCVGSTDGVLCWDRLDDLVIGYFDGFEIEVLRGYGENLLRLLDDRAATYHLVAGVRVPRDTLEDLRLLALLRDELGTAEPDWALTHYEVSCFEQVARLVEEHLATLPLSGGVVQLSSESTCSWLRVIRWYVAVIDAMTDHDGQVTAKPASPTLAWFGEITSGLRTCLKHGVS